MSKKMNVTLYAICKNEERNVDNFIKNAKKFPNVVVVDTGSTDNTVKILRDAGIVVYEHPQSREEFSFCTARNTALSYVKTEWAFSLDFNENVDGLNLEQLQVILERCTAVRHKRYNDNNGEVSKSNEHTHIRFHRTKHYKWVNEVHETLTYIGHTLYPDLPKDYEKEFITNVPIRITKKIQSSVDKELFYLSICEREYNKKGEISIEKWAYYLWFIARHYYSVKNYDMSIEFLKEYLDNTPAYIDPTRIDVFLLLTECLSTNGKYQESSKVAISALSESLYHTDYERSKAFPNLLRLGIEYNDDNLVIFSSAYSPITLGLPERTKSIDNLFYSNVDDIPLTKICWRYGSKFISSLIQRTNPNIIVDLSYDHGFSSFSLASQRNGIVYRINKFTDDDPKKHPLYESIANKRKKMNLNDHLKLINDIPEKVAETWDKKVDILHIDYHKDREVMESNYKSWIDHVNDDGIVIFNGAYIEDDLDSNVMNLFADIKLPKFAIKQFGIGFIFKNEKAFENYQTIMSNTIV
jgi:glycosyltransferase involved in cell wall biosynthesis